MILDDVADILLECKSPVAKNRALLKKLIEKYPQYDAKDIIYIARTRDMAVFRCECGGFKHSHQKYCSRKCECFKKAVVRKMRQTCIAVYGTDNASKADTVRQKISKSNKSKSVVAKRKRADTNMKKYGVAHPSQLQSVKDRQRDTVRKRYGKNHYSQTEEYSAKVRATNNARYGADYYSQSDIGRKAVRDTVRSLYGVDNVFQREDIKNLVRSHNRQTYGTDSYTQTDDFKERVRKTWDSKTAEEMDAIRRKSEKTRISNGEQYLCDEAVQEFLDGWDDVSKPVPKDFYMEMRKTHENLLLSSIYPIVRNYKEYFNFRESYLERKVERFLQENDIEYIRHDRQAIRPLELDFYIPQYNLGIEVNDIWSHNSTVGIFGNEPKPVKYHFNKTNICNSKGIRLIHLFEPYIYNKWEHVKDIILHACNKTKNRVYARNTVLEILPAINLKEFFENNHIHGYRNAKTAFVLKNRDSNEVLMAYLIGKAFFGNGKYDIEIIRGGCRLGYAIIGGASKLWKAIIDYYSSHNLDNEAGCVNSIVYYVDLNLYNGSSMKFLPNVNTVKRQYGFWNFFLDTKELKNRNPKKHKEICQMIKEGKVLIIGNAGTEVNVWHRE